MTMRRSFGFAALLLIPVVCGSAASADTPLQASTQRLGVQSPAQLVRDVDGIRSISRVTCGCGGLAVAPDGSLFFEVSPYAAGPQIGRISPDGVQSTITTLNGDAGHLVFDLGDSRFIPDNDPPGVRRVRFEISAD